MASHRLRALDRYHHRAAHLHPGPARARLRALGPLVPAARQLGWAVALAVAAVLTRETGLVLLFGFFLWKRDRSSAIATIVPAAVAGAWWLWLRTLFPDIGNQVIEIGVPFRGWADAVEFWTQGYEPLGFASFAAAVVVGIVALVKGGLRHPFGWAILLSLAMYTLLSGSAVGPERSAGRTTMGAFILSVIVLVTYRHVPADLREPTVGTLGPIGRRRSAPA